MNAKAKGARAEHRAMRILEAAGETSETKTPLEHLRHWWHEATQEDRLEFLRSVTVTRP